jgi:hypothetical protein
MKWQNLFRPAIWKFQTVVAALPAVFPAFRSVEPEILSEGLS